MSEQPPELRWAPNEPKPRNRRRLWLIVGLVVAALVIAGVLLFLLFPRGGSPEPSASASPTSSATATSTPTTPATPSAEPEPTAVPTAPVVTPPPVVDPSVEAFRDQVAPRLNDALRGLDIVAESSGQDALSVVDTLRADVQQLSETPPPSSIQAQWRESLSAYSERLAELRSAVSGGSGTAAAVDAARSAAQNVRSVVGL